MPFYFLILAHLFLAARAPAAQEDEAHADRSVTLSAADGLTRLYIGAVEMSFGQVRVEADSARVREGEGGILFVGGVRLSDMARSVSADTLWYDRRTKSASFHGSALAVEGTRRLSADRMVYDRVSGLFHAHTAVRLENTEAGIRIDADALVYFPEGDSGRAIGHTATTKAAGSEAGTIRVRADSLVFAGQGSQLAFKGRVGMRRKGLRAESAEAEYVSATSTLRLTGAVRAVWPGEAGGDSVRALADRMTAVSAPGGAQELSMAGSVSVDLGRRPEAGVQTRSATGDSVWTRLEKDRLTQVAVFGSARIRFRTGTDEVSELSAATAHIYFTGGRPDSLALSGSAAARQVSSGGRAESRVTGDSLVVLLQADRVRRLTASGRASCEHKAPGEADEKITLTGDRVSLLFEEGKLLHADADGGVQGSYLPKKAESPWP